MDIELNYQKFITTEQHDTMQAKLVSNNSVTNHNHVFVIAHLRSYSSLLSHILGSHDQIDGYCETHLSYSCPDDLIKLHERVSQFLETPLSSGYVLDKILYSQYLISESLLEMENIFSIFLVRHPSKTLRSIVNMGTNIIEVSWHRDPYQVCKYYIDRLNQIEEFALKLKRKALFIKAENIIENTSQTLLTIEDFLKLNKRLKPTYSIFRLTGQPGYGDPSKNISEGKILDFYNSYENIKLPKEVEDEALQAYERCKMVLLNCCFV